MPDPAAFAQATESDDPFALARLAHPGRALVRFIDPGLGYEFILAFKEPPAEALLHDGDTCVIDRGGAKPKLAEPRPKAPEPAA